MITMDDFITHQKRIMANQPKQLMDEVFTAEYKWIVPIMLAYTAKFEDIHRSYGVSNPVTYKGRQIEKSLGIVGSGFEHKYTFKKSDIGVMGAINGLMGDKVDNDVLYSKADAEIDEILNSFRQASQYFLLRQFATVSEGPIYSINTDYELKADYYTFNQFFVYGDEISLKRKWVSRLNWTRHKWFKDGDNVWLYDSPFADIPDRLEKTTPSAFFDMLRKFEGALFESMNCTIQ